MFSPATPIWIEQLVDSGRPDGLASGLDQERSEAIRHLLRAPFLDIHSAPDATRLAIRHGPWLIDWFEQTLGFRLAVDGPAGFARLFKRADDPDITRTLTRTRGDRRPFDRRRYQLLCLACASLVRHSVTTIGLLAESLRADANLDTTLRRERSAVVDVLRALDDWGILSARAGDLDAFVDSEDGNAILTADAHRLHHLIASVAPPSRLTPGVDVDAAQQAMSAEPRYGDGAAAVTEAQRLRWTRHNAARALFDDPAAHFDELHPAVADYMTNPSGRRWLRDRAAEAGFELEERAEGTIAIDASTIATDIVFPSAMGTVGQLALLAIDQLIPSTGTGRELSSMSSEDLDRFVTDQLAAHPGWAKSHREGDGPARLIGQAVALLAKFSLVRIDETGRVFARPALARYRLAEPTTDTAEVDTPASPTDPTEPDYFQMTLT